MEIKKFDWVYRVERCEESLVFEVIPDKEKPVPETLFKLYDLNDFSVDALLKGYIYGSHPSQLNDYFDCHKMMLGFDDALIRNFLINGGIDDFEDMILYKPDKAKKIAEVNFREILYKKIGIISLTEDSSNLLMWSYYTNHKGFQVEYDFSKFPFRKQGPFPINYCKKLEKIELSPSTLALGVLMQTNLKHGGWDHEREWRILGEKENMISPNFTNEDNSGCEDRKFRYNTLSVIKSIQLGIRFFETSEISPINGSTLKITLQARNVKKRKVLEFLVENEINTGIPLAPELNQMGFVLGRFEQTSDRQFLFNSIEDLNNLPLTLHEAIIKLLQQENRSMIVKEITDALNENGWYKKADGSLIEESQIHERKNKYPDLFSVDETAKPQLIGLI